MSGCFFTFACFCLREAKQISFRSLPRGLLTWWGSPDVQPGLSGSCLKGWWESQSTQWLLSVRETINGCIVKTLGTAVIRVFVFFLCKLALFLVVISSVLGLIEMIPISQPAAFIIPKKEKLQKELDDMLGTDGILLYPSHPRVAPKHHHPLFRPFDFAYTGEKLFTCNIVCVCTGTTQKTQKKPDKFTQNRLNNNLT